MPLNPARRRPAQVAAAILLLAAVAIVLSLQVHSRRPSALLNLNTRNPPYFTVCFQTPVPSDPGEKVTAAVRTTTKDLEAILQRLAPAAGIRSSWIRALVTHESGGNPRAISPTDCAGLVAISPVHLQNYSPCCVDDPDDHAEFAYDLCNSEERNGYRCDIAKDPRFDVTYSLEFATRSLASFQIESGGELGRNPGIFIPVIWNLGSVMVAGFPASIHDVRDVFANLNFDLKGGYGWAGNHDLANKVVEIFDWMIWFNYLDAFWRGERTAIQPAATACIRYDPGQRIGGNGIWFIDPVEVETAEGEMRRLRIKRLAFGKYSEEVAYFTSEAGRPQSP